MAMRAPSPRSRHSVSPGGSGQSVRHFRFRVEGLEIDGAQPGHELVQREEAFFPVQLDLLAHGFRHQEHIAGLQILAERIDRNHLAGADGQRPVLRDVLQFRGRIGGANRRARPRPPPRTTPEQNASIAWHSLPVGPIGRHALGMRRSFARFSYGYYVRTRWRIFHCRVPRMRPGAGKRATSSTGRSRIPGRAAAMAAPATVLARFLVAVSTTSTPSSGSLPNRSSASASTSSMDRPRTRQPLRRSARSKIRQTPVDA